jgi:adenine phosphoribosyltransferase
MVSLLKPTFQLEVGANVADDVDSKDNVNDGGYRRIVNGLPLDYFQGFKNVLFRDIGPLIGDPASFRECVDRMAGRYKDRTVDKILIAESRGYIFGSPLAYALGKGLVQARKKGKLPGDLLTCSYTTEYSTDTFQVQTGRIRPGERVLIVDDLLATGGTAMAMADLVERAGGSVEEMAFVIELVDAGGRKKLEDRYKVFSLIQEKD